MSPKIIFQQVLAMDSIPSTDSTDSIQKSNNGRNTVQEFLFDRSVNKMDFKMQLNCSSSCWRSMITADEITILAIRCFKDNKLVNQVSPTHHKLNHDKFFSKSNK